MPIDFRNANLADLVELLFDYLPKDRYYYQFGQLGKEVHYSGAHIVSLYTQLFLDSRKLLAGFTASQIDLGFGAIQSYDFELALPPLLEKGKLSCDMISACISAMLPLHRDLFCCQDLPNCIDRWFAVTVPGQALRNNGTRESIQLNQVAFETMAPVLELDSHDCQFGALYGLNFLTHPDKERVIRAFIERHPELSAEDLKDIEDCILGEADWYD